MLLLQERIKVSELEIRSILLMLSTSQNFSATKSSFAYTSCYISRVKLHSCYFCLFFLTSRCTFLSSFSASLSLPASHLPCLFSGREILVFFHLEYHAAYEIQHFKRNKTSDSSEKEQMTSHVTSRGGCSMLSVQTCHQYWHHLRFCVCQILRLILFFTIWLLQSSKTFERVWNENKNCLAKPVSWQASLHFLDVASSSQGKGRAFFLPKEEPREEKRIRHLTDTDRVVEAHHFIRKRTIIGRAIGEKVSWMKMTQIHERRQWNMANVLRDNSKTPKDMRMRTSFMSSHFRLSKILSMYFVVNQGMMSERLNNLLK